MKRKRKIISRDVNIINLFMILLYSSNEAIYAKNEREKNRIKEEYY